MRNQFTKRIPRSRFLVASLSALLLVSGSAQGFYWKEWPGSRIRTPDTLTPDDPPIDGGGPGNPPTDGGGPDGGFEPVPGGGPNDPHAPEPSTAIAALMGLAAVGIARRKRQNSARKA